MDANKILGSLREERNKIEIFVGTLAELQKLHQRTPPRGRKDAWIKGLEEVREQIDRCIAAGVNLASGVKRRGRPPAWMKKPPVPAE